MSHTCGTCLCLSRLALIAFMVVAWTTNVAAQDGQCPEGPDRGDQAARERDDHVGDRTRQQKDGDRGDQHRERHEPDQVLHHQFVRLGSDMRAPRYEGALAGAGLFGEDLTDLPVQVESQELAVAHRSERHVDRGRATVGR